SPRRATVIAWAIGCSTRAVVHDACHEGDRGSDPGDACDWGLTPVMGRLRVWRNCYECEESTASGRRKAARAVAGSMSVNATAAAMPTAIWIAASTGRDSPINPPAITVAVATTASDARIQAMARARVHPSSAG